MASIAAKNKPIVQVVGGWAGVSATGFKSKPVPVVVGIILLATGAIILSGWTMAMPKRFVELRLEEEGKQAPISLWESIKKGVPCAFAGAGIGIVFGLNELLTSMFNSEQIAFSTAFGVVGTSAFATTIWLRTKNLSSIIRWSLIYLATVVVLSTLTWNISGWPMWVASAASTGIFHATFFTLAFVWAEKRSGSISAFIAASLEGLGFTAFIVARWLG